MSKTKAKDTKTGTKTGKRVMVSPISGAECPTGAHPGNTGGKPGRSGRKPDAIREALRGIVDEDGIRFVRSVLSGVVPLKGTCEHCGEESSSQLWADEPPTVDNRLRTFAEAARFGLGERREVVEAETIREKVRATRDAIGDMVPADLATPLLKRLHAIWSSND